jgi:hypothetical protein
VETEAISPEAFRKSVFVLHNGGIYLDVVEWERGMEMKLDRIVLHDFGFV